MADQTTPASPLADLLFEEAGVGRCLVAPDGCVLRANAEWLRSASYGAEQVIGKNIIELFPETRDTVLAMHARARTGRRVEIPRHPHRIQGVHTWWEGNIDPVLLDGGTGLLITVRQVPDFQVFYETAPTAFLVLAPDRPHFTILAASEAYMRATKTSRDIIGRWIF